MKPPKPSRYYVLFSDPDLYREALKRANGSSTDLVPTDFYRQQDFDDLSEAKSFAARGDFPEGAAIFERRDLIFDGIDWTWEDSPAA